MEPVFERYLTETEEKQLLSHVGALADRLARRDHAWMRLLRHTGIRVGALAGLTVEEAREALRTNHLPLNPEHAKRKKGGDVFCNDEARKALRELLAIRREQGHAEIGGEPLIMSRNHRGISVRSLQARMQHWVHASGLDVQASPHWMRHTLAKRIMKRSTSRNPLAIVQGVLGHASTSTSLIYAGPDREEMEQAMREAS